MYTAMFGMKNFKAIGSKYKTGKEVKNLKANH